MDKVIVPSEFSKFAFENTLFKAFNQQTNQEIDFNVASAKPFEVVHYPLETVEPKVPDIKFEHDFNFLVVAQNCFRKNIAQTVKEFIEEFYDQPVGMVLKMNTASNSLMDFNHTKNGLMELIHQYEGRKCSIHLLHGDLTDKE
ncbi:MAG: hypothetical protein HC875_41670 [Anaerolineales bacterium]|nr:hypothetical protein [Anaerolineales bacterium]